MTNCCNCGKVLRKNQKKYCSSRCNTVFAWERTTSTDDSRICDLRSIEKGQIAENIVENDLLSKGYAIFKSATGNGSFDLIAIPIGCSDITKAITIEVTCGRRTYNNLILRPEKDRTKFMHLATVFLNEGLSISYEPPIDFFKNNDSYLLKGKKSQ